MQSIMLSKYTSGFINVHCACIPKHIVYTYTDIVTIFYSNKMAV